MDKAMTEVPRKLRPMGLLCRCSHNLISHDHLPCDYGTQDRSCGYPGCKCKEFASEPTPQIVLDAMAALAGYCRSTGYESVTVGRGGGAFFQLRDDPVQ